MLFLFLDGFGIGRRDGRVNPLFAMPIPGFDALVGGPMVSAGRPSGSYARSSVRPLDATLGVPGLPQSGTGQTSLLTGENAPRILGRHFGPYPHSGLREMLSGRSVFRRLSAPGLLPAYLNAFPRQYMEHIVRHPGRTGAVSFAWRSAGFPLRGAAELSGGRALSADLTSEGWARLGYPDISPVSPERAADIALRELRRCDFLMMEYPFTDHAGHSGSMAAAGALLPVLDRFVGRLALGIDRRREAIVLSSDHGNFEDLSHRTHTLNPVPLVWAGRGHDSAPSGAHDLTHILPAILGFFG